MVSYTYTLYTRYSKKLKKKVYYVRFRDPDTEKRMTGISTGQSRLNEAKLWCDKFLKQGKFTEKSKRKFKDFAEEWFVWGKCNYIERVLDLGGHYTEQVAEAHRANLDNYILKYFPNIPLSNIETEHVTNFRKLLGNIKGLRGQILNPKTINNIVSTLSVMLGEAYRLNYIKDDPSKGIGKLKFKSRPRGILEPDEFNRLFDPKMLQFIWQNTLWAPKKAYAINLLAALTGLRISECQGLTVGRVLDNTLKIDSAWKRKHGMGETKTRVTIDSLINEKLHTLLLDIINESPYKDDKNSLVFWKKDAYTPIDHKTNLNILYKALERIGISPEEREERNIVFHSWRHFYVTGRVIANVPGALIRASVGQKTIAMTENYTQIQPSHMEDLVEIQDKLFPTGV